MRLYICMHTHTPRFEPELGLSSSNAPRLGLGLAFAVPLPSRALEVDLIASLSSGSTPRTHIHDNKAN